jgi:hypothetical protein
MKLGSTLSLGAALALGFVAIGGAAPAFAKKEKEAKAPAVGAMSKEVRAAAGAAQTAIKAGDFVTAAAKIDEADAVSKTPYEKYISAKIRLEMGLAKKDTAIQAKGVYGVIASGAATADELPQFNFYAGQFAYQAADYPNAIRYLSEADRLGYKNATDALLLLAESYFKTNQVKLGTAQVDRAIAAETKAGRKAPEAWFSRAASVAYKAKMTDEVAKWTRAQVKAYPSVENWRSALVTYRDAQKMDGQPMLDLFRLMRVTKSLKGERDYFEYAAAATERGLPGEAKAVIDEGFASGTVPKGSRAVNEMLTMASGKVAGDRAALAGSEKQAGAAANGRLAANTADAYLGYGEDAKAVALYRTALTKGQIDVDAVNTRLGIALARSGQKDEARKAFEMVKGPRADIAAFWLLWMETTV